MRFRFTLTHETEGAVEISEPDGWKDAVLKMERHEKFHSLVEYFDGSFIFYGNNGVKNGGISFIKLIDKQYGPDATILVDIDVTFDEQTFSNVFNGQFKLSDLEELPNNKLRVPIIRDDVWAKFISRMGHAVNVQSDTDLDDNAVEPLDNILIALPSQKIRYIGSYEGLDSVTYIGETGLFGMQLDFEKVVIDDLKKFNLPQVNFDIGSVSGIAENLVGLFEAPYDGDYLFDIAFTAAEWLPGSNIWVATLTNFFVQKSYRETQSGSDAFTRTNVSFGGHSVSRYTFNKTIALKKGDQVAIYGDKQSASDDITIFGTRRLNWQNATLATTEPIALTGEQTIDGVLTSGTTVLVKDQGDRSENGLYVSAAGAWTRSTSADIEAELINLAIYVSTGDTNADTAFRQQEPSINLGVSDITFTLIIANDERFGEYPGTDEVVNHLIITGDTIYEDTRCQGFLLHDVGAALVDRIVGEENKFYSDLLGAEYTLKRQYLANGCAAAYGLAKGLQIRDYSLDEKPFFQSFNQWWEGIDPILNLSLGYDTILTPHIVESSPDINLIDALADWQNAPGATWDFVTYGVPFVSVNGNGGLEGYAVGAADFTAGLIYPLDVGIDVKTTGSDTPDVKITWAILDSLYNEIDTRTFNYIGAGVKYESFLLQPTMAGSYFGVKIQNNTPFSTKNFEVVLAFTEEAQIEYTAEDVIRVEDKAHWYDDSQGTSVDLSNVKNITRKYDNDVIFNKVEIGYARWQGEDISGIDDPQTKKFYTAPFKKIGKTIQIFSEFIGASLVWESARRMAREKSTDYKFDNETFIVALNPEFDSSSDTSPDNAIIFQPELSENFTSISGLLNSDTRYNIKLSVGRNFLRWKNYLQGCLQQYIGNNFRFSYGEGNYDMISEMIENDCLNEDFNGDPLDEKGNIMIDTNFLHLSNLYEITHPMEWSEYVQIRNNRKKPIGISQTDTDHVPMFIKSLDYKPVQGTASIICWAKEYLELDVVPDTTPMQECIPVEGECVGALTDEGGNILTDEFGVCLTEF